MAIDFNYLEKMTENIQKKGGNYDRKSKSLKMEKDVEYRLCIIPPIELDEEGKPQVFGYDGKLLIHSFKKHTMKLSNGTQSVPDMSTINGSVCPVVNAIKSGEANIPDYRHRDAYALRAVILKKTQSEITDAKGNVVLDAVTGKPVMGYTADESHMCMYIIDCGKMFAGEYMKCLVSYFRNLQELGESPIIKLSELPAYTVKRTGNKLETVYSVSMLPRKAFILNDILDFRKDDGSHQFEGESKKERAKSMFEYLAKNPALELFMPGDDAVQAFIRGQDYKPFLKKKDKKTGGKEVLEDDNNPF